MTRIYTKKGDDGTTSLWYGGRVPKPTPAPRPTARSTRRARRSASRARSAAPSSRGRADILRVQNELFVAGAELATAPEAASGSRTASAGSPTRWSTRSTRVDRPLHGPGLAAAQVRDPGRHPALRRSSTSRAPSCAAPSAASSRSSAARGSPPTRCCATSTAPPTSSTRWRASPTSTIPSCSRAASGRRRG